MPHKIWGMDTVTGECGWLIPQADAPDLHIVAASIAGDVITLTRSDGVTYPVTITHPAETEQLNVDATVPGSFDIGTNIATFQTIYDVTGAAGAPLELDLTDLVNALTTTPHPTFTAGANVTITGNPTTGYTISSVDTDTDTFATLSGNTITFANGDTLTIPAADGNDVSTMTYGGVSGDIVHVAGGVTTVIPPLRDINGNTVRRDRVQATLYNECGTTPADALPITQRVLRYQAANPITGVAPQGVTTIFDRATLQPLNTGALEVLLDEPNVITMLNPSPCATMIVSLSGLGRLDPQWDDLNRTTANWLNTTQYDIVIYTQVGAAAPVDTIRHSRNEVPPNNGGISQKLMQFDGTAILFVPPGETLTIGRRLEYLNQYPAVPERTPSAVFANMPYISAIGFRRY